MPKHNIAVRIRITKPISIPHELLDDPPASRPVLITEATAHRLTAYLTTTLAGRYTETRERNAPVIGQEAICPDGLGRVVLVQDGPGGWIRIDTYIGNQSCHWDPDNVELIDPRGES